GRPVDCSAWSPRARPSTRSARKGTVPGRSLTRKGPVSPERRLRVLLSPSAYYPHVGGIEEVTRQLARHLRSRGHEPTVVTNRWPAGTSAEEVVDGVTVVRLPLELPAARPRSLTRFVATGLPA